MGDELIITNSCTFVAVFNCFCFIITQMYPINLSNAKSAKTEMGSRLVESMMRLRPRQGNLRLVFRLFSLMRGLQII